LLASLLQSQVRICPQMLLVLLVPSIRRLHVQLPSRPVICAASDSTNQAEGSSSAALLLSF